MFVQERHQRGHHCARFAPHLETAKRTLLGALITSVLTFPSALSAHEPAAADPRRGAEPTVDRRQAVVLLVGDGDGR
jgi:hypothetical protein